MIASKRNSRSCQEGRVALGACGPRGLALRVGFSMRTEPPQAGRCLEACATRQPPRGPPEPGGRRCSVSEHPCVTAQCKLKAVVMFWFFVLNSNMKILKFETCV